jgi:ribosomal protein L12E/L44/L45/RPP1/RPP2
MGEKAFHLKVGEIRDLCDFFALDRTGISAKAELIDCLLDFLSAPSAENVKGGKAAKAASSASKRKGGSSKKKDDSEEESEEEEEDQEDETEPKSKKSKDKGVALLKVTKGEVPADDTLRAWVKCFVQCYDLEKASIKVALQVAGDKFGVDLGDKKELLKGMLADAMG